MSSAYCRLSEFLSVCTFSGGTGERNLRFQIVLDLGSRNFRFEEMEKRSQIWRNGEKKFQIWRNGEKNFRFEEMIFRFREKEFLRTRGLRFQIKESTKFETDNKKQIYEFCSSCFEFRI